MSAFDLTCYDSRGAMVFGEGVLNTAIIFNQAVTFTPGWITLNLPGVAPGNCYVFSGFMDLFVVVEQDKVHLSMASNPSGVSNPSYNVTVLRAL